MTILSKEQHDIAFYNNCEGSILVEASAGSGKTRILTERVRHLLTERKDKFFSVLCLTFTNKAAEEMKERLQGIPKLDERAYIGNFHEFCLTKILRTRIKEIGLDELPHIFNEEDQRKILEEVLYSNEKLKSIYAFKEHSAQERSKAQSALLSKYLNFISEAKRKLTVVPDYETNWLNWGEDNTYLFQEYNRRLINQNAMDYDDILLYAYRILNERPATSSLYRRAYKYIMIDEAQDLNFAQYQILRSICGQEHRNVMMVGDPKQAIYGFNGASPEFMQIYFVNDFGAEKKEIKHNYRSAQKVLELAQSVQPNGGVGTNYFEGIGVIQSFESEIDEAQWIIKKIKKWKETGIYEESGKDIRETIDFKNIAILARTKFVFKTLIEQLEEDAELKGKFYLRKGIERFEPDSILIKAFDLGLRILVNPYDFLHFRQLVNELKLAGIDENKTRLDILLSLTQYPSGVLSIEVLTILVELWQKLHKNPKWLGEAIRALEQHLRHKNLYISEEEAPKVAFDLSELHKFWSAFARKEASENQNISNFRYFIALNGSKENKEELVLATVHTTKGLEFEIVFLMGMCDGVFPDFRAKNEVALKEERNNAYVAVTRAKRCIYVTYPKNRMMPWGDSKPQTMSRFIKGAQTSSAPL
jgi:DNA helicase-2/ATP-dependent DNA helicase PcrA